MPSTPTPDGGEKCPPVDPPEEENLKQNGNKLFLEGRFEDAADQYTLALSACQSSPDNSSQHVTGICYKNRAACYLKLEQYQLAANDAKKAIDILPNDSKALFRYCQATEKLGQLEEAFKKCQLLISMEPKNSAIQELMRSISMAVDLKRKFKSTTQGQVDDMFDFLQKHEELDMEKKTKVLNNVLVKSKELSGAELILTSGRLKHLLSLLSTTDNELIVNVWRIVSSLCDHNTTLAEQVLAQVGINKIAVSWESESENVCVAAGHVLTVIFDLMLPRQMKNPNDYFKGDLTVLRPIFDMIMTMIANHKISGFGRDVILDLIVKNVPRNRGANLTMEFIENKGLVQLLKVGSALDFSDDLRITKDTKMHVAYTLQKLYDDLLSDKQRAVYQESCSDYVQNLFSQEDVVYNYKAVLAITCLLQGPYDIGNAIMSTEGVLKVMMAMAQSIDTTSQLIAVEALVQAASKPHRCKQILEEGFEIIKALYKSENPNVQVRALVGLCKLANLGGHDASTKPLGEASGVNLAKKSLKFLLNPEMDSDLRKWATEGLSFLTLDAEVKEYVVENKPALTVLYDVAKSGSQAVQYAVSTIFVNLTNCYDKDEVNEEMVKLAEYAHQHVPTEHKKDSPEFVKKRIHTLIETGLISGICNSHRVKSEGARESFARVFCAACEHQDHRGAIVQQGGVKALLSLANENSSAGKLFAAHALARMCILMDPAVALPGQRSLDAVKPLISLLGIDQVALRNFESLLALTNLAAVSSENRRVIFNQKGVPAIENYMYEEHALLRRSATECMCNMLQEDVVFEFFLQENDRVKLWTLFSGEEDELLVKAATGGLAILTENKVVCEKIIQVTSHVDILIGVCMSENLEIVLRGICIVTNLVQSSKEIAEHVIDSKLLEALMLTSQKEGTEYEKIKKIALTGLKAAQDWGLIKAKETPQS